MPHTELSTAKPADAQIDSMISRWSRRDRLSGVEDVTAQLCHSARVAQRIRQSISTTSALWSETGSRTASDRRTVPR